MELDQSSSERLKLLRFPLIAGVVFIHAYKTEVGLSNGAVGVSNPGYMADFFRNLISQGIARTAVPLFFLMSGYLFFINLPWSYSRYKDKLHSRVWTLLVPFLFWNVLTLFVYSLGQRIPATQSFFAGKRDLVATFGAWDYVNAIIGIDRFPISYQFWFIRDLIVLVVFSPLIHIIIRGAPRLCLGVVLAVWFSGLWPIYVPSASAFLFFYAGAYIACSGLSLFELDRFGAPLLFFYVVVLLIDTITKELLVNQYVHNFGILLGVVSVLFLSGAIGNLIYVRRLLLGAAGCSFFVFAVHEPLLTVVKKVSYKIVQPDSDAVILMLYLVIPTFVIFVSVVLYWIMQMIFPRFLSLVSGGR